jgi:hypothetical protein
MTKVPSLNYDKVVNALRRAGWVVVRQRQPYSPSKAHARENTKADYSCP